MTLSLPFVRCLPNNFTSLERTPWAGHGITQTKGPLLQDRGLTYPARVGESWEVSTDPTFPSQTQQGPLPEVIAQLSTGSWGLWEPWARKGCLPLLLKWLEASEALSVQVHPPLVPHLAAGLCGKHESWLVMETQPNGCVYLGFQEGVLPSDVEQALANGTLPSLLYKFYPKPFDYIAVPPGCVHAIGAGVLLAEPQVLWPGCSGVTYRLFDWNRRYNSQGFADLGPGGQLRPLHLKESLATLNWELPLGKELEKKFVTKLAHGVPFLGDAFNSFPCTLYTKKGSWEFLPLVPQSPTLLTVWSGKLLLKTSLGIEKIETGESGLLPVSESSTAFALEGLNPRAAFFSLSPELLPPLTK